MKYSQLHRFYLIDGLLYINPEGMSTKTMLDRINASLTSNGFPKITVRQLQLDLNKMKELLNAPINNGRGRRKIKYDDISFCVFNRTRNPYKIKDEKDILNGRLNWLRFQMDYMQECFFNDKLLEVMDYEDNMQLTNIDSLPIVLKAIIKERLIKFNYAKRFSTEDESRIVHPYFLHQYNNRWYLFALYRAKDNISNEEKIDGTKDGIRCYALDRMSNIKQVTEHKYHYESITTDQLRKFKKEYFTPIVGVKNDERKELVDMSLYFNYNTGDEKADNEVQLFFNLLKSNPFYRGFCFEENRGDGYARAMIRPNPELDNHLMIYAHTMYISDDSIRERIVNRAKQILAAQDIIAIHPGQNQM